MNLHCGGVGSVPGGISAAWDQEVGWASGASYGGLLLFLHFAGGVRFTWDQGGGWVSVGSCRPHFHYLYPLGIAVGLPVRLATWV